VTRLTNGTGVFYTLLAALRDDLRDAFQQGQAPFNRIGIVPGAIAWDECDQCGLLALAVTRHYLSDEPPLEYTGPVTAGQLGNYLVGEIAIQGIRCAPTVDDRGNAPTVEALDKSGQQIDTDAILIICTVIATLTALEASNEILSWGIRQQVFMGPEGACAGSELAAWVTVTR
jgi:hypothetical protein